MKLTCPACRREIPPDQINVTGDMALCPACGEVMLPRFCRHKIKQLLSSLQT